MITEKQQKIVDAVNALRGELTEDNCGLWVNKVYLLKTKNSKPYVTAFVIPFPLRSTLICKIEEFNQCVKEMSVGGDPLAHAWYVDPSRRPREELTKENSDYSYYEKENKMFKKYEKVMANGSEYLFGCINPVYDKFCILFDADGEYCHAHIAEVKAKPKTEKRWVAYNPKSNTIVSSQHKTENDCYDSMFGNRYKDSYQYIEVEVSI